MFSDSPEEKSLTLLHLNEWFHAASRLKFGTYTLHYAQVRIYCYY